MIVGTLALLMFLFGGGGLEYYLTNLKSDVKEHVVSQESQSKIIEASKTLSADLEDLQEEINDHFGELVGMHTDFESTAADFDEITSEIVSDQKMATKLILDARDRMHAEMTKAEWEAVFQPLEK